MHGSAILVGSEPVRSGDVIRILGDDYFVKRREGSPISKGWYFTLIEHGAGGITYYGYSPKRKRPVPAYPAAMFLGCMARIISRVYDDEM